MDDIEILMLGEDANFSDFTEDALPAILLKLLGGEYRGMYMAQTAHWNIMGSDFAQLHAQFEGNYEASQDFVDEVAEFARRYRVFVPAELRELLQLSGEPYARVETTRSVLISELNGHHERMKLRWDDAATKFSNDAGFGDLAGRMSGWHSKMAWQYRSLLASA